MTRAIRPGNSAKTRNNPVPAPFSAGRRAFFGPTVFIRARHALRFIKSKGDRAITSAPDLLRHRLIPLLSQIYPSLNASDLCQGVTDAFWPGDHTPRKRPRRPSNNLWSESDTLIITYGDSIVRPGERPLRVLNDFLSRTMGNTVSGVHILPFFPYSSDDGFAVKDYMQVNPDLGDWDDVAAIGSAFGLMSDMVLNHVSSEGTWFQAYLDGIPPYDRFFMQANETDDLSAVVRPRTSPLLRKVETANGSRYVWCTFSHDQVDLDFHNPQVLLEILRILRFHIDHGVRIIRLDAVAFLWKEPGSPSVHLPQTHAIVKLMRVLADFATEPVILLTETNVPRAENLSYFGRRDEAHMVYQFPLPPLVLHAMLSGSVKFLRKWLRAMPPAPLGCAYFNFTASHDGIGMRPVEGILPPDEITRMITAIRAAGGRISMRSLPGGGEAPYELNCGYFDAMTRTFQGETAMKIARFLCSQTIVMSIEGVPAFYIHSFLATPNDLDGLATRGINRAINRRHWNADDLAERLADPGSEQSIVLRELQRRLRLRRRQSAFHPNATQLTLQLDDRILAVWRQSPDRTQSIFALHNVSDEVVTLDAYQLNLIDDETWRDLLSNDPVQADGQITMAPCQCRWVANT